MKRAIFSILILSVILAGATFGVPGAANAEVSAEQWQNLLLAAGDEKWTAAVDLAAKCLADMSPDDERLPRLRYMYIYVLAGKYSQGHMSYDQFAASLKPFVGQKVVLPYREISSTNGFNFIIPQTEAPTKLMVSASNKSGTTILAFEYVTLKQSFDWKNHQGEKASVHAVIDSITPSKSRAVVMRVRMSQGEIVLKKS